MENKSVADRLEGQSQAVKGTMRTLSALRERYADKLKGQIFGVPEPMKILSARQSAGDRIAEAVESLSHFDACIGRSVIAEAVRNIIREIPGVQGNEVVAQQLRPLDEIVQHKVWSTEERRKLFTLCFGILRSFEHEFCDLIAEVCGVFPEETKEI